MNTISIFQSAKETSDRLAEVSIQAPAKRPLLEVTIDPNLKFQTWIGFGGALTEASALTLRHLPPAQATRVIRDYYDPQDGHGFTLCRIPLGGCDFSEEPWSTVETPEAALRGDFDMSRFDALTRPYLEQLRQACGTELGLLISPWSPPAFMKTNANRLQGGKLLPEWRKAWARQYSRFIEELTARGFRVWAVTIQNEPEAVQTWDSCLWTAQDEADFTTQFLKPDLVKHGFSDVKILHWDHNRDRLWDRAQVSYASIEAQSQIDGMAFHWYCGDHFENVAKVAQKWPNKLLVFTEGCVEGGPRPGAWFSGERYAHNVIGDMNAGAHAWIDWNLVLNEEGGPNHVGNFCDAPVLVDRTTKTASYQSSFFALGHFSRWIKPGARRVACTLKTGMIPASVDGLAGNQIEATAWINEDETLVLVVTNRTEAPVSWVASAGDSRSNAAQTIPPRGMQTIVWKKG